MRIDAVFVCWVCLQGVCCVPLPMIAVLTTGVLGSGWLVSRTSKMILQAAGISVRQSQAPQALVCRLPGGG